MIHYRMKSLNCQWKFYHHTNVNLFNLILSQGLFPSAWSKGFIVPLHKSGKSDDPNNFRGICTSSCLGKCFTSIMNTRNYKQVPNWIQERLQNSRSSFGFENIN
jgi:hypothetical protein